VSRSDIATQGLVLATVVAVVVGAYSLIPHIRADGFTPVLLEPREAASSSEFVVSVRGDAARPGLYTLDSSTSLADVLRLASAEEDETSPTITIILEPTPDVRASQKVDLNHADAWLLAALPGIGPDRAQAIVDFRAQRGPFASIGELTMVPGIGSATYEALQEFATVTP